MAKISPEDIFSILFRKALDKQPKTEYNYYTNKMKF